MRLPDELVVLVGCAAISIVSVALVALVPRTSVLLVSLSLISISTYVAWRHVRTLKAQAQANANAKTPPPPLSPPPPPSPAPPPFLCEGGCYARPSKPASHHDALSAVTHESAEQDPYPFIPEVCDEAGDRATEHGVAVPTSPGVPSTAEWKYMLALRTQGDPQRRGFRNFGTNLQERMNLGSQTIKMRKDPYALPDDVLYVLE